MKLKTFDKCKKICYSFSHIFSDKQKQKHFTFIIDKNKIISVGYNNTWKTCPDGHKHGYRYDAIHSEIHAIKIFFNEFYFKNAFSYIKRCTILNFRISPSGQIMLSKPCNKCMKILRLLNPKRIIYTDCLGNFHEI